MFKSALPGSLVTDRKHTALACLRICRMLLTLLVSGVVFLLFVGDGRSQNAPAPNRLSALSQRYSRAETEAEQLVSLSSDQIIELLGKEPGLLLEIKKMLVRTAFDQGRILDPKDLTDEALYRLLAKDDIVRAMVTREMEDRGYVRVKPTQAELKRQQQGSTLTPAERAKQEEEEQAAIKSGKTQEEVYWEMRQKELLKPQPQVPAPTPPPQGPQQQLPPQYDQRRALQSAQLQSYEGDYSTELPLDPFGMERISPDQLSGFYGPQPSGRPLTNVGSQSDMTGSSMGGGGTGLGNSINSGWGSPMSPISDAGGGVLSPMAPYPSSYGSPYGSSFSNYGIYPYSAMRPRPSYTIPSRRESPMRHRPNVYADIPSLYDLYSQFSERGMVPRRFGEEIFVNGTGNFDQLPMDLPAGPDYVLGPGDGVSIDLWGGISQRLRRVVDREGKVALPEVGTIQVAGRSLGDVQHAVQTALRSQFRDVQADVSLSRLRTLRVYVVGDVQSPGAYEVSSLSTPLNALYEAGGPTSQGSLRTVKHYRGKQLLEEVDVYDLLLHGVQAGSQQRLEAGDSLLVPPLGGEVTVSGMVRRPAIYELRTEKNLAEVLELAGGVLPSGTLRHIDVERVEAHQNRTMLSLDIPDTNNSQAATQALENFQVQPGDKIKIAPIVAFAENSIFLDGHVFKPGKYAYRDGMKLNDLVKSYKDLLPEPYKQHAEIIRLNSPDYRPEILSFNLDDALSGKTDVALKPLDTVRVFGRYDFEDSPVITVTGAVRDPGDHVTNGATYLRDAVFLAGNATPDAQLEDVQIFRKTNDGKLKVFSVSLAKALNGNSEDNILLEPKDRVIVHKNLSRSDPPSVTIAGEVARPGKYPLTENMTAAALVRLSGGLKRSAYTDQADLTRYTIESGQKIMGDHQTIQIARALAGEPDTDFRLHDGDVLTIRQLSGWNDRGATITVKGEVMHPGIYGIQEGERLSSILERAGGLRSDAYAYGAVFERIQVRDLQEKNRSQLIRQVQDEGPGIKAVDDPLTKETAMLQWKSALEKLERTPPVGRMVIHISSNTKRWANTASDIQVRDGDVLYIPKKPNFVMVDGAVYNPTAVTFKPGKNAGWYLRQAGGPSTLANRKAIFVIHADGSVVGGKGGVFSGGATDASVQPGDMVVVPDKAFGGGLTWKNTLQVAQLVSAVGIAVQVARSF